MIAFEGMTFLIGPNGAGKTAVLQALARLFAFDPNLRRARRTDFHVLQQADQESSLAPIDLWIEAQRMARSARRDSGASFSTDRLPSRQNRARTNAIENGVKS